MKNGAPQKHQLSLRAALAAGLVAFAAPGALVMAAPGGGGSGFSPSAGPQIDPAQSYRDGLAALEAGDYATAEKKFGEVLQVARDNPEANYYMGLAKIGRGKAKKLALVAAARKILVWAWTIFSRQTDWNPDFHQIGA